jgi:hypothetical protein
VLIDEALQTARRYVVLASRRGVVWLRFSGKPFSHTLPPRFCSDAGANGRELAGRALIPFE